MKCTELRPTFAALDLIFLSQSSAAHTLSKIGEHLLCMFAFLHLRTFSDLPKDSDLTLLPLFSEPCVSFFHIKLLMN